MKRTGRTLIDACFALWVAALAGCSNGPGYVEHNLPGREPGEPTLRLASVRWGAPVGDLQAGIAPEIDLGEVAWYDPDARPLAGLYLRNLSWKQTLLIPHPAQLTGWSAWDNTSLKGTKTPPSDTPGWDLTMIGPDGKAIPNWLPMRRDGDPVEVIRLRPRQTIVLSASLNPSEWGAQGATAARYIFSYQNNQPEGFVLKGSLDGVTDSTSSTVVGVWQGRVEAAPLEVHYRKTIPNETNSPTPTTRPTTGPAMAAGEKMTR